MTDRDIVLAILSHKEIALEELKIKYGRLLYGVINKIINPISYTMDIEECFNDVLLTIWKNIDCYDENKGQLRNFLISIAKYRALDYKRKISKTKIHLELNEEIIEQREGKEDATVLDDEAFYHLIENLNEKDKVIFVKKYLLDEPIEKISIELEMSKEAIYKRLIRGREKIKESILKEEGEEKCTM
ncbi:sigma-70 family RNA polymerase sigma factor [Clostridium sp. 'White wine YQ']|uniref:sigma-70 family RNA polymerase sigma factor n=1 Tax=Clostridium sp. 'White wine YQ' TaxID=3027474 RepID=UPI002365CCB0|nr:sigma-70 family RNA polymerase sigma factor [Clostridium sp. 'White wine YQ']MDD7795011.1 sigma-70 family RNA polymerase sigma factor [Clostridium sp. 'White wine YQ']